MSHGAPPSVCVVGSLNQDLVVLVPRHPVPGETVLGREHFTGPGGKGANQAVAAARLGAAVVMVGKVGNDAVGADLLAQLGSEGVDTTHVVRDESVATGLAVITVDDAAENAIVVSPGANAGLVPAEITKAALAVSTSRVVLAQLEVPLDAVQAAAEAKGGRFVLNPAPAPGRPLAPDLLDLVDVLVPNRTELAVLAGGDTPDSVAEVRAAAGSLDFSGPVVVTLGDEGAMLVVGGEAELIRPPVVQAVDTTGAGDAFCGALAEALGRDIPLDEAVQWAVHAGAFAVTGLGAQGAMPTAQEVRRLLGPG